MLRLTLRGLGSRKLRSALTAMAVFFGVAMVSGTFVLSDTINRSFDDIFAEVNENVDVTVRSREAFDEVQSGTSLPPFDASVLASVREVPGVATATGSVGDTNISILDEKDDRIGPQGPPHIAGSVTADPFDSFQQVEGREPETAREVAIDTVTAERERYELGDRIRISGAGGTRRYEVVGLGQLGGRSSIGGAALANFILAEAQRLTGKAGEFDEILIAGEPGVSAGVLKRRIARTLPRDLQARTGTETANEDANDIQDGLGFLTVALLVFAGIAVFVGMFLIFNTFSITVVQRTREFALLRTLGASARQIVATVTLEAAVIGLLASALGIAVGGILFVQLILALFKLAGFALPADDLTVEQRAIVIPAIVGIACTLVAALVPALRATRVSPLEALQETGAQRVPGRTRRRTLIGYGLVAAGLAIVLGGFFGSDDFESALSIAGVGLVVLFIGLAMVGDRLVRPIAVGIGTPIQRLRGVTGLLARENVQRNPRRTATTAAALMIGLALVTFVSVFAEAIKHSFGEAVDDQFAGDLIVWSSDTFSPIPATVAPKLDAVREVETVAAFSYGAARIRGASGKPFVSGIDPRKTGRVMRIDWTRGSPATLRSLGRREAIVEKGWADSQGFEVGDVVRATTRSGHRVTYRIRGEIDDSVGFVTESIAIPLDTFRRDFGIRTDQLALVEFGPGVPFERGRRAVDDTLQRNFPNLNARDQGQAKEDQQKQLDQLLNLIYALLFLSVVVSVFGVVNTLVLTIHERIRELGMLRAIGTSRRQVRQMVRYESVITSLIGATIGLVIGVALAIAAVRALEEEGLVLDVPPVGLLVAMMVAAGLAGVVAAIWPARRASRIDVIEALQYE